MSFAERFPYAAIAIVFIAITSILVAAEVAFLHAAGFVTIFG